MTRRPTPLDSIFCFHSIRERCNGGACLRSQCRKSEAYQSFHWEKFNLHGNRFCCLESIIAQTQSLCAFQPVSILKIVCSFGRCPLSSPSALVGGRTLTHAPFTPTLGCARARGLPSARLEQSAASAHLSVR